MAGIEYFIGGVDDELSSYQTENTMLREKLVALSSLTIVSSKAAEMGFIEEKNTFSLSDTMPIASKQ